MRIEELCGIDRETRHSELDFLTDEINNAQKSEIKK